MPHARGYSRRHALFILCWLVEKLPNLPSAAAVDTVHLHFAMRLQVQTTFGRWQSVSNRPFTDHPVGGMTHELDATIKAYFPVVGGCSFA